MVSFARVPEFTCQVAGCCQVFDTLEDYEHHYHTLHRNMCSFCKRAFPSGHLLDIHILEWHDSLFQILSERQDMVGDTVISGAWTGIVCLRVRAPSFQVGQGQGHLPLAPSPVDGGDIISISVSVLGGRLHREVQDEQRQEGSLGETSPLPCGLPV